MTKFVEEQRAVLSATEELRRQLLGVLDDNDLGFRPAAGCLALGELCREMGEIQHTYIESFRTFAPTTRRPPDRSRPDCCRRGGLILPTASLLEGGGGTTRYVPMPAGCRRAAVRCLAGGGCVGGERSYQLGTAPSRSFCSGVPCSRSLVTRAPSNGSRDFIQAFW